MSQLDKAVFDEVSKLLPNIRQLIKDRKYMEADMEIEGINKWLETYDHEVVKDEKYLVSIKAISRIGQIICHCGAIKEKKYETCYDCLMERKHGKDN